MSAILILSGHYDRDPGIDKYLLALVNEEKQLNQWSVISSHVNGQKAGDQHKLGGLLPPVHHCADLAKYEVGTKALDLTHQAGIRGSFYRIYPFEVITNKGTKRGDFGIHLDADSPGSLGCIVMDWHNFRDFEKTLFDLRHRQKVERVPLYAFYS